MSLLDQTVEAIKEAMRLAAEVRRASDTLKDITEQIRDHGRRITAWRLSGRLPPCLSRRRLE